MKTFDEMQDSREYVWDLSNELDTDYTSPGFIYLDSFFVAELDNGAYCVPIGNTQEVFSDLSSAEEYLWNEFVDDEVNYYAYDGMGC